MSLSPFEELVLLSAAHVGPEAYGMAVRDEIAQRTGRRVSLAAVYSALGRLERADLLESWTSPPTPQRGGRAIKHFALTPRGRETLHESWLALRRLWDGPGLSVDPEAR